MNSMKKSVNRKAERVLIATKSCFVTVLSLLLITPIIALAQDVVQVSAGTWLRIYTKHVQGIYVKAEDYQHDVPIKLGSVVVALSGVEDRLQIFPEISLVSFVSGKEGEKGCMFEVDSKNGLGKWPPKDMNPSYGGMGNTKDLCGRFRLRIADKLMPQAMACASFDKRLYNMNWTLRTSPIEQHWLFVSNDLRQVRCLKSMTPLWADHADSSGMATGNEVSIEGDDRVRAYLHLENNKIFNCPDYGKPVRYRRKFLPETEAIGGRYPFYLDQPTWQKQYFIKTPGFNSSCWGGLRVIDEPISANSSLYLNDGTILLKGEISVLRIRTGDGSTEAPHNLVKVFDPDYAQGELDKRKGDHCEADYLVAGDCTLAVDAGYRNNGLNDESSWEDYARHVIQGVDAVMQQIFNNAK